MVAAEGGHIEIVVVLIKHGAHVSLNDRVKLLESAIKVCALLILLGLHIG